MKLIDLLVKELPGRGGWRNGARWGRQYKNGEFYFTPNENHVFHGEIKLPISDDWNTAIITREQYEAALAAAGKPAWDGDGLPSAGCDCEMQDAHGNWGTVTIISHSDGFSFGWDSENKMVYFSDNEKEFRPIRTDAQRKRELAVNKISDLLDIDRESGARNSLDKIYNWIAAGKIPGLRLDDETGD